jgi:hypothetical protein
MSPRASSIDQRTQKPRLSIVQKTVQRLKKELTTASDSEFTSRKDRRKSVFTSQHALGGVSDELGARIC